MAVMLQFYPWLLLHLLFLSSIPFSSCQPQNIETVYPFDITPSPPLAPPPSSPPPPTGPPLSQPQTPLPLPPVPAPESGSSSNKKTIVTAVAATAASTIVVAAVFFFALQKYFIARRRREKVGNSPQADNGFQGGRPGVPQNEFTRFDGNVRGVIVDENGLDVLYWRRLEEGKKEKNFQKEMFQSPRSEENEGMNNSSEAIQEMPLLRGKSSSSHIENHEGTLASKRPPPSVAFKTIEEKERPIQPSSLPLPPAQRLPIQNNKSASPPPPPPPPPPLQNNRSPSPPPPPPPPLQNNRSPSPPPPPPPPLQNNRSPSPPPPPPPPLQNNKSLSPPPPPPPPTAKKNPAAPPPPPLKPGGLATSLKPPSGSKRASSEGKVGESSDGEAGSGNGQVKMKPLHWDKVNKNGDHSMVWDKIDKGSFRFDGDLMEALFGYVATNRKSPPRRNNSTNPTIPNAQIMILDPRKSQNTAIVLKSLALSRKELLGALKEGKGLNAETLEKLTKIAPTQEEQSKILAFDGEPTRLADAESFHYHILKAVPSTYTRLNAMLFRSNYELEILHLKESLETLELGCKELRTRGLFMKLLEAILKAGNRMNAGTARGNAQAFNLTSLRKLSDVKSMDGKTTLLHFVVEEVVRAEGRRCVISRNHSLSRSSSKSSNSSLISENSTLKDDKEKEYIMLGLPVVGGLSAEFSNVKKAATIDYDTFSGTCSSLSERAAEILELVTQCEVDQGGGGFVREMKGFLEAAEEELKVMRNEQKKVVEIVRKTTEYYQAGPAKHQGAHQLQLFVIIKDFLGMVDQVCVEIARNLQRRRTSMTSVGSSPKSSGGLRTMRFPNLPEHFFSDKSRSNSSESDSDS